MTVQGSLWTVNVKVPIQWEIGYGKVAFFGYSLDVPLREATLV